VATDDIGLATVSRADEANLTATLDAELGVAAFDFDGRQLALRGSTISQLLRALSLFLGYAASGDVPASYSERTSFQSIGLMLDASRNAVPTIDTVKLILRKLAMLGMNQLMLYTEDTYEVPGQPLIGYLRGRYSQAELRELDAYAERLGIEIIPCIQALAHLSQMLRWPAFKDVCDTHDILLVDEPKTYELLEQMIAAASAPFRTKRIHLGMDEAHDIGLGRYMQLHGVKRRFDILSSHLTKASAICQKLGLRPMIWSDMYFRLAAKTGDYYASDAHIQPELVPGIPEDLQLVYWDYYHTDPVFYRDFIARHRVAQRDILFAAGVWTWNTFWAIESFARLTSEAGLIASREAGLKEVFTTAWGDDGAECDFLSTFIGLTHFAANAYRSEGVADLAKLRRDFRGALDADYDAWLANGGVDHTPGLPTLREIWGGKTPTDVPPELTDTTAVNFGAINASKTLLWQDPLLGVADANLRREWGLTRHYRELSSKLEQLASHDDGWGRHALPLALSQALALKAELGIDLLEAYQHNDRSALQRLADDRLPATIAAVEQLREAHRRLWHDLYKPFGWEVLDCRYGALLSRLHTAQLRLRDYLAGQIAEIAELAEPRHEVMPWVKDRIGASGWYRKLISPSVIT
jgi:hypothetical protein